MRDGVEGQNNFFRQSQKLVEKAVVVSEDKSNIVLQMRDKRVTLLFIHQCITFLLSVSAFFLPILPLYAAANLTEENRMWYDGLNRRGKNRIWYDRLNRIKEDGWMDR